MNFEAMKKASIVSIGNELLSGQTVDTNVSYLGSRLFSVGMAVVSLYTVPDEPALIVRALGRGCSDADVVVVTGGLGPTDDDITRQAVATLLGTELRQDAELLQTIEVFFATRNAVMPARCKVQACVPAGARALANELGTAPGIEAEVEGKLLFALPGVPAEMRRMFEASVFGKLQALTGDGAIAVRKIKCFGAGESQIAELVGPVMARGRNPQINCTGRYGVITLHITATAEDKAGAEGLAGKDERLLRAKLGKLVFGTGEQSLAEVVGRQLARCKQTIAVAESCTGGRLAGLLTDVPGASDYFRGGWVAYSNQMKVRELGIGVQLVERYGAVSEQVASAMAGRARKKAAADVAIGITGIAGPGGGSAEKPVGLVYIGLDWTGGCETKRYALGGDRNTVRERASRAALNMLRLRLEID